MSSLTLYTTLPQAEHKAVNECRRHGIKAYPLPIGTRMVKPSRHAKRATLPVQIIASGYVLAHGKPADALHTGHRIGTVASSAIAAMCKSVRAERKRFVEFAGGSKVKINRGPYADIVASVVEEKGSILRVDLTMFGRPIQTTVHKAHAEILLG